MIRKSKIEMINEVPAWHQRNATYSPPDRRDFHHKDLVLKAVHATLPLCTQHWLRDSGTLRAIADGAVVAGVPLAAVLKPSALTRLLQITRSMTHRHYYGTHPSQYVEEFTNLPPSLTPNGAPAVVFVHGGAWGSGRPWMYRLIVDTLLRLGFGTVFMGA